nr:MAG TPA: hypothetical protein [Caudoviricetes sp.]
MSQNNYPLHPAAFICRMANCFLIPSFFHRFAAEFGT